MKKVILTGFGPFGPYQFNPTKDLVEFYNGKIINDVEIVGVVLPCTYYGGFEVLSKIIDETHPDAIISTGFSSSVKKIRFETKFRNIMNGKYPDADGYMPRAIPISKEFSIGNTVTSISNSLYLEKILNLHQIPVEISENADNFFCNSLGWLTSKELRKYPLLPIRNMFIHIPCTDDYQSQIDLGPDKIYLKKEILHEAIDLLIECI